MSSNNLGDVQSSTGLVRAFIDDEGTNLHQALGADAYFDSQRAEYVPNVPV